MWMRLLLIVLSLVVVAPASAHEIGTTRVVVRFPTSDTFQIDVVTDGQALLEKLQAVSPSRAPSGASQSDDARLAVFAPLLLERVAITFDTQVIHPALTPTFTPSADQTSPPIATLVFRGPVPAGARQLSWRFGWTFASYALSIDGQDDSRTQWIDGGDDSEPIAIGEVLPPVSGWSVFVQYLALGFTHIVPKGLDHILFVVGLFLLGRNWRALLAQVSAFTVAHTLTLGLAMNGLVSVRPAVIEPLIALSIAYVAIENMLLSELRPWRIALVFGFGLLHGLGFAGVLGELGLPRGQFVTALTAFNIGVEGGQLSVIAAAAMAVGWWRSAPSYRTRVVVPASLAIACIACYWTVQRLGY